MTYVATAGVVIYRCSEHGVWFDKERRAEVTREFAGQIAQHRHLLEIVGLLKRGDDASFRSFARVIIDLETQIGELRREIERR